MAMRRERYQNKGILLVAVLCMTVVLCNLDHWVPSTDTAEHGHPTSPGCIPDVCVTLTSSKDMSSSGNAVGFLFLLFGMVAARKCNIRPSPGASAFRCLALSLDHPPKVCNKLYQLHAAYLI
jgi:hypothetical protein